MSAFFSDEIDPVRWKRTRRSFWS